MIDRATTPEERLAELGHELPAPNPAVGRYVGAVTAGNLVFVSGHGPYRDGGFVYRGKLGREVDVATGRAAAQLTILNLLASLKAEIGELDRVRRVVKLLVLVNSDPEFGDQPAVADGASDLLVSAFGADRGAHARSAIGMGALPFSIPVEIEGIFEIS
ncbi:MAG TPA: RidA family protein [Gaiellaceae bacterium]|jgi:enamine deaminase RidA (YjgF/YER057c/UK114 family)|nr:RidA family protein [Gaiellaceae bacterium]